MRGSELAAFFNFFYLFCKVITQFINEKKETWHKDFRLTIHVAISWYKVMLLLSGSFSFESKEEINLQRKEKNSFIKIRIMY
jgi:hypothetical protein